MIIFKEILKTTGEKLIFLKSRKVNRKTYWSASYSILFTVRIENTTPFKYNVLVFKTPCNLSVLYFSLQIDEIGDHHLHRKKRGVLETVPLNHTMIGKHRHNVYPQLRNKTDKTKVSRRPSFPLLWYSPPHIFLLFHACIGSDFLGTSPHPSSPRLFSRDVCIFRCQFFKTTFCML